MRPIPALLCTGWKRMAEARGMMTRWISTGEGRPQMVTRDRWREMDHVRRWIAAGYGSWPDMDRDRIWMDDRRWIMGDGWQSISFPFMKIFRLCEVIPFSKSWLWIQSTKFQWNPDMHVYDVPAAWLHRVRYHNIQTTTQSTTQHYSEIPNYAATYPSSNAKYDPESDPESQLQCR